MNNKNFERRGPKAAPLLFLYKGSIVVLIDFIAILLTPGIFLVRIVNTNMYLIRFHSKNIIKMRFPLSGPLHRQGGCLAWCGCTFDSAEVQWFILCTRHSGGTAHQGGGCDQSIGSTVSDAIVRSWLWLTATRNSPVGCFSTLLQVVGNWHHFLW